MFKVWIIASNEDGCVSSHVLEFETQPDADAAYAAVESRDHEVTYTQLEAIKLYKDGNRS
jgi:hypothetical protein